MGTPVISPLPMVVTRAPPLREIPTAEVTCSDECIVDGESPRAWATCPRPRQSRDSSVFVRWSHVVARRYATASSKPRGSTGRSPSTRVASCPLPAAVDPDRGPRPCAAPGLHVRRRSEEHTSELQSRRDLVCRLLLEKKKKRCQQPSDRNNTDITTAHQ